jgi:heme exporter protein B
VTEFIRQVAAIAGKDLLSELRNKEVMNAALSFTVVVLLIFSFAFEYSDVDARQIAGGLLWIVYLFAGILIINPSIARESANDCIYALVTSPVSSGAIFIGKVVANSVLLLLLELISLPIFSVFYNVHWARSFDSLLLIFALGTWALTAVGTIFSAVTVNNRLRELMLPLLVFPITVPALMACVQLTGVVLTGEPIGDSIVWLKLLIAFNIIFTLLGSVLIEVVLLG